MLQFSKYQGLGNDFLVVDLREQSPSIHPETRDERGFFIAQALCDRRLGVGGDGVLTVGGPTSPQCAATMRVLNADGSEAEMCGNGLRCVVKYLLESAEKPADSIAIDTCAGPLKCNATWHEGKVVEVTVDMGSPALRRKDIPMSGDSDAECMQENYRIAQRQIDLYAISMGNPHAIAFVSESGPALLELATQIGPALETHVDFPERTNAEFAKIHSSTQIELVVWERGVGITQACGTGACATVVAACRAGHCQIDSEVEVRLLGGSLFVRVLPDYQSVLMRGPAQYVYSGSIDLASIASKF